MSETPGARQRLDLFLFRTRFYKSRGMASDAVERHGVRITRLGQTRRVDKPSATVSPGDVLSFTCAQKVVTLDVLALPERRGPAAEASACYALLPVDGA